MLYILKNSARKHGLNIWCTDATAFFEMYHVTTNKPTQLNCWCQRARGHVRLQASICCCERHKPSPAQSFRKYNPCILLHSDDEKSKLDILPCVCINTIAMCSICGFFVKLKSSVWLLLWHLSKIHQEEDGTGWLRSREYNYGEVKT